MKYISICSGIEAATVAWHGLGWTPLAFSEIDPFPSAVLAHHYPSVPNLGDMTKYRDWPEELLAECDFLVGGTPCQAFSVAGQRRSLDDERGNLSLIYVHLFHHINEVRKRHGRPPTIALWENVPGVLSTKDNAFGCFVGGLLGVDDAVETQDGKWPKAGFLGSETVRVGYRILDAQYFAVAQRRRRVFLVAVPCEFVASVGERACPSEILSLRESVLGNPPTRGAKGQGSASGFADGSSGGLAKPLGSHALSKGRGTDLDNTTYVAFHPTQDPISSVDGSTHAMGCGSKQGCCTQAVAFQSNLGTRGGDIYEDGSSQPLRTVAPPAVAFTKSKRAQSTTDDESWVPGEVAPTQNQFDVGDTRATTVVAYDILGTMATNAGKETDCHTALRSRPPGQSEASTTTVVAFTQNSRDEVREIDGDGQIAGALSAEMGMHQTNYLAFSPLQGGRSMPVTPESPTLEAGTGNKAPAVLAFANRSRDGVKMPEVMKDGVVPALTNPGRGGRADAVNVATHMQVRRLTPTECCRLQGFPDDHCDIVFRKKPAADGPKYRALGNSMAVPCMAWLGWRIHNATQADNQ